MAKQYVNPGQFAGSWEVQVQAPLDDRSVVTTVTDLTDINTWLGRDGNPYHYKGMVVSVADTGEIYVYIGDKGSRVDVVNPDKWIKVKGEPKNIIIEKGEHINEVGEASVTSDEQEDGLHITFDYLKGEQGKQGLSVRSNYLSGNKSDANTVKTEGVTFNKGVYTFENDALENNSYIRFNDIDWDSLDTTKKYVVSFDYYVESAAEADPRENNGAFNIDLRGRQISGSGAKFAKLDTWVHWSSAKLTYYEIIEGDNTNYVEFKIEDKKDLTSVKIKNIKLEESDVDMESTAFIYSLKELEGSQGEQGEQGITPDITLKYKLDGEAEAVEAEKEGNNEAPTFTLDFSEFTETTDDLDRRVTTLEGVVDELTGNKDIVASNLVTDVAVGGLKENIDVSGKNAIEILEMILRAEYAPRWVNATASLTGATTLSVGDNMPQQNTFVASGEAAKAIGKTTATGGAASDEISIQHNSMGNGNGTVTFNDQVVKRGIITVNLTRSYAAGNTAVVTTKGNNTNKSYLDGTEKMLLVEAKVNNNIDADTYFIKESSANASVEVKFAYPVFIDDARQELDYEKLNYSKTRKLSEGETMTFEIPAAYTNYKICYLDAVTGKYVDITSSCTSRTVNRTIGTNTVSVSYRKFSYTDVVGEREYRIEFTIPYM